MRNNLSLIDNVSLFLAVCNFSFTCALPLHAFEVKVTVFPNNISAFPFCFFPSQSYRGLFIYRVFCGVTKMNYFCYAQRKLFYPLPTSKRVKGYCLALICQQELRTKEFQVKERISKTSVHTKVRPKIGTSVWQSSTLISNFTKISREGEWQLGVVAFLVYERMLMWSVENTLNDPDIILSLNPLCVYFLGGVKVEGNKLFLWLPKFR